MKNLLNLIALFSISAGIISCNAPAGTNNAGEPPVVVSLNDVALQKAVYYDTYPGNLIALKEVELRGNVSGYITGIFFEDGSVVHKGQKLYEIDRSKYQAAFEEDKANVEIAQADLDKVRHDYDRYTELSKQDAIAKQRLDYAKTDVQNAALQVEKANAELIKAKTDLDYSLISAPFDGTIGISQVKMGALVTPGQTLLNIISSDDPVGVDIEIDEKELGRYQDLEKKTFQVNDSTFRLILPDNSLYPAHGKIGFIDRAVNPQTGTIRVRLIFPDPGRRLRPGMNCKLKVLNENNDLHVLIPLKAIVEQMGEFFVFLDKNGKAVQLKVSLGKRVGDMVIVEKGLASGDKLVTEGIQRLHDGSSISAGLSQSKENNKKK